MVDIYKGISYEKITSRTIDDIDVIWFWCEDPKLFKSLDKKSMSFHNIKELKAGIDYVLESYDVLLDTQEAEREHEYKINSNLSYKD